MRHQRFLKNIYILNQWSQYSVKHIKIKFGTYYKKDRLYLTLLKKQYMLTLETFNKILFFKFRMYIKTVVLLYNGCWLDRAAVYVFISFIWGWKHENFGCLPRVSKRASQACALVYEVMLSQGQGQRIKIRFTCVRWVAIKYCGL